MAVSQRKIGDINVSAIGLGAMPMSIEGRPQDRQQSIRTIPTRHSTQASPSSTISNADVTQIREANEILSGRLASVQNQFSPSFRSSEDELTYCAEQSIAFLPWSPLGGIRNAAGLGDQFAPFAEVAVKYGVTPHVVCLAWELAKADVVIPSRAPRVRRRSRTQ